MRTSVYLLKKCENLSQVISYFSKGGGFSKPATEIRLSFLAQIDFWDWEMAELAYSIQSFEKRSKAWGKSHEAIQELNKQGFVIKNDALSKGTWRRENQDREETVAPIKEFKALIEKWNKLIGYCEKLVDGEASKNKLLSFIKEFPNEQIN